MLNLLELARAANFLTHPAYDPQRVVSCASIELGPIGEQQPRGPLVQGAHKSAYKNVREVSVLCAL
jgi:hypothetical protein